jgi:hypothetical protein
MGSTVKEAPHSTVASLMLKTKDIRGTCKRFFNKTEDEMDAEVAMKIIKKLATYLQINKPFINFPNINGL